MWFRGLRVSKGLKAQRVDLALKELKALRVRLGNEDLKGLKAQREGLAPSMTWTMATGSMTLNQTSMTLNHVSVIFLSTALMSKSGGVATFTNMMQQPAVSAIDDLEDGLYRLRFTWGTW